MLYNKYSDFLKKRYGEKVYKLPVKLPVSCPNRDGVLSYGGCAFCGSAGAAHEALDAALTVREQLAANGDYIGSRYGAQKFLAYFQEFTSTHQPVAVFYEYLNECIGQSGLVGVVVSTRPDCVNQSYIELFRSFRERTGLDVYVELGLQTANWRTLARINRGHGLAEFVDAVLRCHLAGIEVCAHVIPNLPDDTIDDVIETARILSALRVEQVKIHALYIAKGSKYAAEYQNGAMSIGSRDDYIRRVCVFLRNLDKSVVVQRLIGRAPERDTLFANWGESWWKIHEAIEKTMSENDYAQGDLVRFGDIAVVQ